MPHPGPRREPIRILIVNRDYSTNFSKLMKNELFEINPIQRILFIARQKYKDHDKLMIDFIVLGAVFCFSVKFVSCFSH